MPRRLCWDGLPDPAGIIPALVLVVAGTAALGALGVLLGGALRAEVVLAWALKASVLAARILRLS